MLIEPSWLRDSRQCVFVSTHTLPRMVRGHTPDDNVYTQKSVSDSMGGYAVECIDVRSDLRRHIHRTDGWGTHTGVCMCTRAERELQLHSCPDHSSPRRDACGALVWCHACPGGGRRHSPQPTHLAPDPVVRLAGQ